MSVGVLKLCSQNSEKPTGSKASLSAGSTTGVAAGAVGAPTTAPAAATGVTAGAPTPAATPSAPTPASSVATLAGAGSAPASSDSLVVFILLCNTLATIATIINDIALAAPNIGLINSRDPNAKKATTEIDSNNGFSSIYELLITEILKPNNDNIPGAVERKEGFKVKLYTIKTAEAIPDTT